MGVCARKNKVDVSLLGTRTRRPDTSRQSTRAPSSKITSRARFVRVACTHAIEPRNWHACAHMSTHKNTHTVTQSHGCLHLPVLPACASCRCARPTTGTISLPTCRPQLAQTLVCVRARACDSGVRVIECMCDQVYACLHSERGAECVYVSLRRKIVRIM